MALYPRARYGYWEFGSGGYPLVGVQDENVLEDFEDQSLSGYGGQLSWFRIQGTNVISGRYSLEAFDDYVAIGDDGSNIPTPRTSDPTEYQGRIMMAQQGDTNLLTNVQSESSPMQDCYVAHLDATDNHFGLIKRVGATTEYIELVSLPIDVGTEYRPAITTTTEGVKATLYDSNDSMLAETGSYRDTTHSGGGLGFHNAANTETYFDHVIRRPGTMGNVARATIENFEDANLSEYDGPSSSGTQSVTPGAAYGGNYGLEMNGFGSIFTRPGMGLNNYIRDGVPFEFLVNFRSTGSNQYYFYLCPQHTQSTNDVYELEFLMGDGVMRIQKDSGGSETTLSGHGTNEASIAYTNALSYWQDYWYRVEGVVDSTTPRIRAELYDPPSGDQLAYVEATSENEFIAAENGFGFYSSGGGTAFFDEVVETG